MPIIALDRLQQFAAVNVLTDPGAIPGPVQVPFAAQIVIVWALPDGHFGHNVLYGRYAGTYAGTVAQANAIHTALTTGAAWTALAGFLHPTTQLFAVSLRDVNTINQPILQSTNAGVPGTGTGVAIPDETALVITLRTALVGPQNRGRVYIPGWSTTAIGTTGTVAAGAVTALQNWANTNLRSAINNNGYTWVIGQKARQAYTGSTGRQHPARGSGTVTITSQEVRNNTWDSQRRRGLK